MPCFSEIYEIDVKEFNWILIFTEVKVDPATIDKTQSLG